MVRCHLREESLNSDLRAIKKNRFDIVNLDTVQKLMDAHNIDKFTITDFTKYGILDKKNKIKILGRGLINKPIYLESHAISSKAKKIIDESGSTCKLVTN